MEMNNFPYLAFVIMLIQRVVRICSGYGGNICKRASSVTKIDDDKQN